ncbi:MAG: putative endonuclease, partial [Mycobacterium sp.]|nr:putative endonuclease [Mycobacterium sp.]
MIPTRIAHLPNTYTPPDDAARVVVFVEVKTRTSDQFGGVAQAVSPNKVRRLRRLAGLWL